MPAGALETSEKLFKLTSFVLLNKFWTREPYSSAFEGSEYMNYNGSDTHKQFVTKIFRINTRCEA